MLVKLLAPRGAGGKTDEVLDVPFPEAERLFRKGTAQPVRVARKPEKAVRKRKKGPEHATDA